MTKIIPFKKEHFEIMEPRSHEDRLLKNEAMLAALERSIAYTAISDGRIVCCYGAAPYMDGLAEIWLLPSIYVEQHGVELAKEAKKFIATIKDDLNLHRAETLCLDDEFHNNWMKFLGFELEGKKRKYINGMDYSIWGLVWE